MWRKESKILPVTLTSAVALDPNTVTHLKEQIGAQTGSQVLLEETVDPDIIGGIVVRVGNQILDASIRTRLEQLRRTVAAA
jgi:ATP synthase F1 delta subunit